MEEYFDVLDEFGNKTGKTKLREEVHRDGDYHRSVHIWIVNQDKDFLLQRRCESKDSFPNMLDISCAGHLSIGDDSLTGAIRELKEELNLDIKKEELQFLKTIKKNCVFNETFIDNEYNDLYLLRTDKKIEDMKYQESEISEIFYVPYNEFKKRIEEKQEDLLLYPEEFEIIFSLIDDTN